MHNEDKSSQKTDKSDGNNDFLNELSVLEIDMSLCGYLRSGSLSTCSLQACFCDQCNMEIHCSGTVNIKSDDSK